MIKSITYKVSVRLAAGAVGVAMVVSGFSVAAPAFAAGLTQTQIQSILSLLQSFGADQATINNVNAALNGQATTGTGGTSSTGGGACPALTRDLKQGSSGADVKALQQFLNTNAATQVAASGAGSPGSETTTFGPATKAAVMKFQTAHSITPIAGYVGAKTRAAIAAVCGTTGTAPGTGTGTTTTGTAAGTAVVAATAQPANAIAPQGASRVPFTAFTVTANGAPVTVNSVAVTRQGPSLDTDFSGVVLVDASTGAQLGTARILDANHSAVIGTPITIPAGTSKTFWVEGNIQCVSTATNCSNTTASIPGSGDVASFAVTAVNTASTVSGSFPIVGASNTINTSLTIGTASIQTSSFDPSTQGSQPIGTTGYRFTGIRIQAGSAEDVTFKAITWYNSGSASGIANMVTVVNGTSYPTTVDSTGRYYTAVFPSGIVIPKGQSVDVYVQGDLGANTTANTYAEFDIYRNTDIYLVGNTYGYGITPTVVSTGSYNSSSTHNTIFVGGSSTPWIQGSTVTVTAGQFSTIQNATSVGAQNIAVNVPNQPLGGFQTNLTGEAIQAQSIKFHFLVTGAALDPMQNISLVNQNGSVVAGPYNATCDNGGTSCNSQSVTFTGSLTFPTGANTYTLEGQLQSQTGINGNTIQASTTPSSTSDWSNVTGATTGNNVSIGVGLFTMNTMTVQAASLTTSNGTTPTNGSTIVAGGQNILLATVQLDASQSGEDVQLSSIPMSLTTNDSSGPGYLSSCQVWNGSTALNTGSRVVNGSTLTAQAAAQTVTFSLDNALRIPKGTVLNLPITCNISSAAPNTETYTLGVGTITATGVTSGSAVTVSGPGGTVPTINVSSGATLAGSTDSSSPAYAVVAGGTTGVTLNVIKFRATNEAVNLQKVGLKLVGTNATSSDLTTVYLYSGNNVMTTSGAAVAPGTLIGTATFAGGSAYATSTLSTVVQMPVNQDATVVVKADLASIGVNKPGTEGANVAVNYDSSRGVGANSGKTTNGTGVGATSSGVRTFASYPTFAAGPAAPSNPNGIAQVLKKFSVTASNSGSIGLDKISISIASSSGITLNNVKLIAYTDSGYSIAANVPGSTSGQFGAASTTVTSGQLLTFQQSGEGSPAAPLELGSGQTIYFSLLGDVSVNTNNSTWTVSATVKGDSGAPTNGIDNVANLNALPSNFVWSSNATSTSVTTSGGLGSGDWTNGYGVSGLPSSGF
ncbi:MAG: peptidoglycan-binding protein [Patescibacteria group bacterium]|nr:peptidoglycan-binding protein [Patescibacteria group bacterium]